MLTYVAAALAALATVVSAVTVGAPATSRPVDGLPYEAVRVVAAEDVQLCSAVTVAPGRALTAKHCLQRGMTVDGYKVEKIVTSAGYDDIAVLHVPGLVCPCVAPGVRPAKGDQVIAVGFPADREGNRAISAVARVHSVGALRESFPALPWREAEEHFIVSDAPIITHGDSGGGLFSLQDGEWKVIGINAIGVPAGPCLPFVGCGPEIGSGFVPVDLAEKFL